MITDLPKHNLKAFIDVAKEVDEMQFGTITVTLRVHKGYITDIVYQEFKRKRFDVDKQPTGIPVA